MSGANFMDELDCGSFFAHIDDLIEFLADNETGLNMIDFPSLWTDNSDTLPWSDQYYPAATAIAPPTYLLNLLFRFLQYIILSIRHHYWKLLEKCYLDHFKRL